MSEYNRHRWAMEWMYGGGRDPHGLSLDEEIKLGKEEWTERQRVAQGGRIGLQSGQLVQPGPGRQGYGGEDELGRGVNFSINELSEMFGQTEVEYIPARNGEYPFTLADYTKANRELGWTPTLNIKDYISEGID